tara:strand:- start:1114 stop:1443 length:330 start_codon:yes stop_codon:yes gene_type:complete
MVKLLKVVSSNKKNKKFDAIFKLDDDKEKTISFGAKTYRDYTLINNKDSSFYLEKKADRDVVKERYIQRHKKREDWSDPMKAGTLSRFLLWNRKTLKASITDYKKQFNL